MRQYGVRCVFRHGRSDRGDGLWLYEERTVLVRASGFADAIRKAELDAQEYVRQLDDGTEYLAFAQAFSVYDDISQDGAEVFCLMRSSPLGPDEFIDRYLADGSEHEKTLGDDTV